MTDLTGICIPCGGGRWVCGEDLDPSDCNMPVDPCNNPHGEFDCGDTTYLVCVRPHPRKPNKVIVEIRPK